MARTATANPLLRPEPRHGLDILDFCNPSRSVGDRLLDDMAEMLWRTESMLVTIDEAEEVSFSGLRDDVRRLYDEVDEMMKRFAS